MANVVIQTAFLGDVLLSFPLLKRLKKLYPDQKTILICRDGLAKSLQELGIADEVLPWNKADADKTIKLKKYLNSINIKNLIVPHRSVRTAIFAYGINAEVKTGFKFWWNAFIFNKRVMYDTLLPDAVRQWSLLSALDKNSEEELSEIKANLEDLNPITKSDIKFKPITKKLNLSMQVDQSFIKKLVDVNAAGKDWQSVLTSQSKKIIAISPGSVWNTKRWTEEGFTEVSQKLAQLGFTVLLLGSKAEVDICKRIKKSAGAGNHKIIDLSGQTTVTDIVVILNICVAAVTNDNGAMHLAALAGTPVLAIFGPTVLSIGYRPWNDKAVVIQKDLPCRPCGMHGSHKCPIDTHDCMKQVEPSQVIKGLKVLIPELMG